MKTNNKNLVSIVVVTLNASKLLKVLFESIEKQNYKNIEVVINDDLKTVDDTKELISEWQKKFPITYINKNSRLGEGRIEGAKVAKGEYLMHIDADMRLTENLITDCIRIIDEGADAVKINEEVIGEGFWTKCKWLEKKCYFYDEGVTSPRFFKTTAYFEVGGHNPNLALSEDKDIDLKFKDNKKVMKWTDEIMYHDERRISIIKTYKNKFYWSQTGFEFLKEQPKAAWKQALFVLFRPAYFKSWKLLLRHPLLTIGMYMLKFAELIGATLGGLGTKLGIIKPIKYKTLNEKK